MIIDPNTHSSQINNAKSIGIDFNGANMSQSIVTDNQFSFAARELPARILEYSQAGEIGYWQHQFDRLAGREPTFYWNVGIANGQIIYSGNRQLSAKTLLRVVERYVPHNRHAAKLQFEMLRCRTQAEQLSHAQLFDLMKQEHLITEKQLVEALRIKILNDLDIYLLMGSGSAKFVPGTITDQLPVNGFSPIELLDEAERRQSQWTQLRQQVPSMKLCPILDRVAIERAKLSDSRRLQIEKMAQADKSLNSIAEGMAKDNLEVAQMFAKLASMGLVQLKPHQKHTTATVMVIDDSPVLLSQFNHWVSALGYSVITCENAKNAIATIKKVKPAVIFIDINMPEISGFELVKQIRQRPEFKGIALTILTGEQKLSNKWRAQWSGCEFLTKPLSSEAIGGFQVQLEELIPRLLNPATAKLKIHTN